MHYYHHVTEVTKITLISATKSSRHELISISNVKTKEFISQVT